MKPKGSVLLVVFLLTALAAGPAAAQKKKGVKASERPAPLAKSPEGDQIDMLISEMLAVWQVGDTEMLHKYFADDVTVVSGAWEPPLIGWAAYLKAYQAQRARMQSGRLDRRNTLIATRGNLAWADYQWDFVATVENQPVSARGHTTLVLEKRAGRWVIVHNHTSAVSEAQPPPSTRPSAPSPPPPAKPGD